MPEFATNSRMFYSCIRAEFADTRNNPVIMKMMPAQIRTGTIDSNTISTEIYFGALAFPLALASAAAWAAAIRASFSVLMAWTTFFN